MKRVVIDFLFVLMIMLAVLSIGFIPETNSRETYVEGNLLSVTDNEGKKYSIMTDLQTDPRAVKREEAVEESKGDFKVVEEVIIDVSEDAKKESKTKKVSKANKNIKASPQSSTGGKVGDIGRLSIPSVGYAAAVYNCSGASYNYSQRVTDAKDSASYITCAGSRTAYIGDHNTDGFANMKSSVPGTTLAYITRPDGTVDTYMCMAKYGNGRYEGTVFDDRGVEIFASGYDIAMVTCNSSYVSVTITYWNKI